jgi:hypothetical protein
MDITIGELVSDLKKLPRVECTYEIDRLDCTYEIDGVEYDILFDYWIGSWTASMKYYNFSFAFTFDDEDYICIRKDNIFGEIVLYNSVNSVKDVPLSQIVNPQIKSARNNFIEDVSL